MNVPQAAVWVFGVHWFPPPHTFATAGEPAPQSSGDVQVPQSTVPPQPSATVPHDLAEKEHACAFVFGVQAPPPTPPSVVTTPPPQTFGVPPPPQIAGAVHVPHV